MKNPADRRKKKDDIKVTVKFVPLKRTPEQQEAREWLADWLYEKALKQMEKNLAAQSEEIKAQSVRFEK